jgi:hypothetical protein
MYQMWSVFMQLTGLAYEAWREGQIAENNRKLAELLGGDFSVDFSPDSTR